MKKTFFYLLMAASITLTSCGGGKATNLNTPEGVKSVKQLVIEQFGGDTEVYSMLLSAEEDLSSDVGSIVIRYLKDDVIYSRQYMDFSAIPAKLNDEKKERIQGKTFTKNKQGKVKISDLNFDMITNNFNKAVELIGSEYEDFQLNSFMFSVNNKNEVSADFEIQATKAGEGTSMEGRNIVTNFYEFEFDVNEEGELSVDE